MSNTNETKKAPDRLRVLERIAEYERDGKFDTDVEDDPPTVPLKKAPDYTCRKLSTKIATKIANKKATEFFDREIAENRLIIKEVIGMENYRSVDGGAFITCNHFNANDNYAVFKVIQKDLGKKDLYKIIREGNYTSFKGIFGYFFRHCNTLPIPSNHKLLREFFSAVDELLARGEKILIYPEQGMWWNYKKPRPLKDGAFRMAAKANKPVIPFFITMEDSEYMGDNGFPIQAYTVHIMPPIYPDISLSLRENTAYMREKNYSLMKEKYEEVYGIQLSYSSPDIV